jgi:glycosyltransferase involved in cell wall biosynthesis
MLLFFFFKTVLFGDPVAGFPATICIILLLGGIQLFCMGILGQYLSKTYLETKKRPIYIVKIKK